MPYASLQIDAKSGLLRQARQCPSPNFDERPENMSVDLIVIHNISLPPGQFGGREIDDFFTNKLDCKAHPFFAGLEDMRVSAHVVIRRDGEIVQYVPFDKRAWHAGKSNYGNRTACNDFSVGIELEGTDSIPYTEEQYSQLEALTRALIEVYPTISFERIVGHCDIAPGRKSDPGVSFDWPSFRCRLEDIKDI